MDSSGIKMMGLLPAGMSTGILKQLVGITGLAVSMTAIALLVL